MDRRLKRHTDTACHTIRCETIRSNIQCTHKHHLPQLCRQSSHTQTHGKKTRRGMNLLITPRWFGRQMWKTSRVSCLVISGWTTQCLNTDSQDFDFDSGIRRLAARLTPTLSTRSRCWRCRSIHGIVLMMMMVHTLTEHTAYGKNDGYSILSIERRKTHTKNCSSIHRDTSTYSIPGVTIAALQCQEGAQHTRTHITHTYYIIICERTHTYWAYEIWW